MHVLLRSHDMEIMVNVLDDAMSSIVPSTWNAASPQTEALSRAPMCKRGTRERCAPLSWKRARHTGEALFMV